jgi:3-hydroxy-9,10-secoandrosta-1,3,5(10)-triene-9,17-dione monooxygenase reductase component
MSAAETLLEAPRLDTRDYRRALGVFPTGITVVTSRGLDGSLAGVTVNSFASVSLDPPLVLWSLAVSAGSNQVFQVADHFAVHVLAQHQREISQRFARTASDKFEGMAVVDGIGGVPLIDDVAARFECKVKFRYSGGDHTIFVGEVLRYQYDGVAPLVYHHGNYASVGPHCAQAM